MIIKLDYAVLKENTEFYKKDRLNEEEIKYNYCPKYWKLEDYETTHPEWCGQDCEDCFCCWDSELTEQELIKYNELKEKLNGNK